MPTPLLELFWALLDPWLFMRLALTYLPTTLLALHRAGAYRTLLSPSRLRHAWFTNFWSEAGPNIRLNNGERITALLEGRVSGGVIVRDVVQMPISGRVVDVGPGSGYWVDLFAGVGGWGHDEEEEGKAGGDGKDGVMRQRRRSRNDSAITKVYGVEPNTEAHASLRRHVAAAGLEGKYEIVAAGVEELSDPGRWGGSIEEGSVDCIVTLLCLCSIPEPERNVEMLYRYLKKGGRWYLYEHVRARRNWGIGVYQMFINIFWPQFLGGCQLCRDTEATLRSAGPWAKVDVFQPPEEPWYQCVPHIIGTFTK